MKNGSHSQLSNWSMGGTLRKGWGSVKITTPIYSNGDVLNTTFTIRLLTR